MREKREHEEICGEVPRRFRHAGFFNPPKKWLAEAGVKRGYVVLDFGCGHGAFTDAAAKVVGREGRVYALDADAEAILAVEEKARRKKLSNVTTIRSDGPTGLPDASVDVVLLYDCYHELDAPESVRRELARVLKGGGKLSFADHHLPEKEIIAALTGPPLFALSRKYKRTYSFVKTG